MIFIYDSETVAVDDLPEAVALQETQTVSADDVNTDIVAYEPYLIVLICILSVISGQLFSFFIMYKWRS